LRPESQGTSCPSGWQLFQGNCYGYFSQEKTWFDAEVECRKHRGAHLASVHSIGENKMLIRYITRYHQSNSLVWIGLLDLDEVGAWDPSDGKGADHPRCRSPNSYTSKQGTACLVWALGQPS
uniref:C-type lectin domain-containing protein n=1 Tax=Pelusios castaneus TaxID=367368 RepID=A0A8C8RPH7_9SAUR